MPKSPREMFKSLAFLTSPLTLATAGAVAGGLIFGGLLAPIVGGIAGAYAGVSIVISGIGGIVSGDHKTPLQVAAQPFKFFAKKISRAFTNARRFREA